VKKFADRLVISNELLEDESAGLLQYVAEWFAPKYILTQNSLLLPMLTGLESVALTAGSEDKILRQALITKLNTAHAKAAQIITNQSGFAEMSGWEDGHKRALLVPDATAEEILRYRGKPVHYGDDSEFPTKELYVGNFKALGTLFVRKGFEMATSNVGGDAWATDSTEIRVICRMDAQEVDGAAAFKATFGA
jgi:HK97 family phage major capsid protein